MINIERRDKIEIISFPSGKINALVTDEMRDDITKVLEGGNSRVIIDLKGVQYIDSSGFGCLLSLLKIARNNYGTLKFANPEPPVRNALNTLNLQTVLDIYDDINTCIRALR
jgi:anti-anti-sigma factor